VLAVVFVGRSKRFPNKHFEEVKPGLRVVDLVLNSLRGAGVEILIFSKILFEGPAPFLVDPTEWIIPAFLFLFEKLEKKGIREFLAVGGDMPLISPEGVSILLSSFYPDCLALVPRWNNGWVEPLFAIYTLSFFRYLRWAFLDGAKSLQSIIRSCDGVKFIEAEKFPSYTFFNVNTREDLFKLREIIG